MKTKKQYRLFGSLFFIAMILVNLKVHSQDHQIGLSVGDAAPPLVYSKLIKGANNKLSDDKITVLEFWATWCVPCIAAMPHLSELAEKYGEKVDVIAVNVLERTGDKPYSVIVPKITEFVEKMDDKMRFTVVVDDDEKNMDKKWLRMAEISGIPATIIVKDKKIYWIGHPFFLEKILKEITDGSYNIKERKKEYEKKFIVERKDSNHFK